MYFEIGLENRRWAISNRNRSLDDVIFHRLIEHRDTRTQRGVDKRIEIVAKPCYHGERFGRFPFMLNKETQPVLAGKIGQDVARERVVPVVRSIGQAVACPKVEGMLKINVIRVPSVLLNRTPASIRNP